DVAYSSFLLDELQKAPPLHVPETSLPRLRRLAHSSVGGVTSDPDPPSKQQRWSYDEQRGGGVHSTYMGRGGAKGQAMPLPLSAQLEGVWRVHCCSPGLQDTTAARGEKPAAHNIATQTCRPPSAAANFFNRSVNASRTTHIHAKVHPFKYQT
ncbi:Oxygen-regulated protein 1, partial [Dissostichus eleginoides]